MKITQKVNILPTEFLYKIKQLPKTQEKIRSLKSRRGYLGKNTVRKNLINSNIDQ